MRRRRSMGVGVAVALALTLAACGSDGGGGGGGGGNGSGGSGTSPGAGSDNPEVAAYCQAVDDFVDELGNAGVLDLPDLQGDARALADQGSELAGQAGRLGPQEVTQVEDCSQRLDQAVRDAVPGG